MALVAAALCDPLPSAAILGVRVVAALLAALIDGRPAPRASTRRSAGGEALLARVAAAGLGVAVGLATVGSATAARVGIRRDRRDLGVVVTGMALLSPDYRPLSVAPLVPAPSASGGRGPGVVTQGVLLVRVGLAEQTTELEVARALLLVTAAACGAALARAAAIERGAATPTTRTRGAGFLPRQTTRTKRAAARTRIAPRHPMTLLLAAVALAPASACVRGGSPAGDRRAARPGCQPRGAPDRARRSPEVRRGGCVSLVGTALVRAMVVA